MHDDNTSFHKSPFPESIDPDGLFPLNPDEIAQIEGANALAMSDCSGSLSMTVWPRFRDDDGIHLTGRCPSCGLPRGFGLNGDPLRRLNCPCGQGMSVCMTIVPEPIPADLEYEINHEPEDLALMATILERPAYTVSVLTLDSAKRSLHAGRRISRGVFRTTWEAIARSGIFDERHAIMVENGAHCGEAMRSLVAAFIRGQHGATMRERLKEAAKKARHLVVRGETA